MFDDFRIYLFIFLGVRLLKFLYMLWFQTNVNYAGWWFTIKLTIITLLSLGFMSLLLHSILYLQVEPTPDAVKSLDEAPLYLLFNSIQLISATAVSALLLLRIVNRKFGVAPKGLLLTTLWTTIVLLVVSSSYLSLWSINSCRMCLATLGLDKLSVGGICSHKCSVYLLSPYCSWFDILKVPSSALWLYNAAATGFAIYLAWAMLKSVESDPYDSEVLHIDMVKLRLLIRVHQLLVEFWSYGAVFIFGIIYATPFMMLQILLGYYLLSGFLEQKRSIENREWRDLTKVNRGDSGDDKLH